LVGVKGIITNHPEQVQGLVMPLLDPSLKILAHPPSFETCSRDVYPPDTSLSKDQATHIAAGVKLAMQHLHAKGLMHGDLYAHNILWNDTQLVLSDLGGASFLPIKNQALASALMQLDQRAYQVLLEELANLATVPNHQLA
jgi:serine/threonine protein kinase